MSTTQPVLIQAPNSLVFLNSAIYIKQTAHPKPSQNFFQLQNSTNCAEIKKFVFFNNLISDSPTHRKHRNMATKPQGKNQQTQQVFQGKYGSLLGIISWADTVKFAFLKNLTFSNRVTKSTSLHFKIVPDSSTFFSSTFSPMNRHGGN
jgi:hypothetical protein